LQYGFKWFTYHARQRLATFKFYLVIYSGLAAAVPFLLKERIHVGSLLLSFIMVLISILFWQLDVRNRQLIQIGEMMISRNWAKCGLDETTNPAAIQQVRSSSLRALAISSLTRSPDLPDVPTIAETGLSDYEYVAWFGVFAPGTTRPELVARINALLREAVDSPETRERLRIQGVETQIQSPNQFRAKVRAEIERWGSCHREIRDQGFALRGPKQLLRVAGSKIHREFLATDRWPIEGKPCSLDHGAVALR
jgi:hypothetical protein